MNGLTPIAAIPSLLSLILIDFITGKLLLYDCITDPIIH